MKLSVGRSQAKKIGGGGGGGSASGVLRRISRFRRFRRNSSIGPRRGVCETGVSCLGGLSHVAFNACFG